MRALFLQSARNLLIGRRDLWGNLRTQPYSSQNGILTGIPKLNPEPPTMALLTDTKARSGKLGGTPLAHGGVTGLALHPSPSHKGQGKWVLRYVSPVTKKRRNAGLGS